jgi:hypothetical protein
MTSVSHSTGGSCVGGSDVSLASCSAMRSLSL